MGLRGRYIKDIELHLPDNEIEEEIKHFLQSWDFYPTVWKEESCFCADYKDLNGMGSNIESLKRMYFFKSVYANGILHIEAWVRDGKNAETGITGAYNFMMKRPYLYQITTFENTLINKLPDDSELRKKNQETLNKLNKYNTRTMKAGNLIYILSILLLLWAFYEILVHIGILP